MKSILTSLAIVAVAGIASAQTYVTNTVPGGGFEPTDLTYTEITNSPAQGGGMVFDFPTSGGNPDGYARIQDTSGGTSWGVWVIGNTTPVPLSDMGLSNNMTYTFFMDMKTESGTNTGGLKIESWGSSGEILPNSGDMRPVIAGTNWATYSFTYKINPGATGLKLVGLWGNASTVCFDNVRVEAITTLPLNVAITSPSASATVNTNFTINVSASVIPGTVTNVDFYRDATLLGSDDTAPFSLSVVGAAEGAAALTAVAQDDNGMAVTSSVVNVTVVGAVVESVYAVDPGAGWLGFMTWFFRPQEGGANPGDYAGPWGVADLKAVFSGVGPASALTLKPAPINDPDPYWYDYTDLSYPTGMVGAVGFREMEASMYVQIPDGAVNGNLVTFAGTCNTNTLDIRLNPGSTNLIGNGWTNYAYVKDFAPDYSSFNESLVVLTSDAPFSVSLQTIADPTRHIQYGFITRGPNVWPTDVDNYGMIEIQSLDVTPTNVVVDSSASWTGFMNVFSQDGTGYEFGSGWGTADLVAVFNSFGLTLSPNTIGDPDPYWYVGGGGPGAVGNKTMDASMYVEIGSLPGRKLIFSGNVLSNTLVSASNTNAAGYGWTSVAFIKDFAPDYSSFNSVTVPLTPGAFSIELNTINDSARHVQYGFETVGPNVWVTDVEPFGNVVIGNAGTVPTSLGAAGSGGNINLSFSSQLGKAYTVLYKDSLTNAGWNSLLKTNGTGATITIDDPATNAERYYRLSIQ